MPEHFKLWQRRIGNDYASHLDEISGIGSLDTSKVTLICLPGYSTTHEKHRQINGYMGIAQEMLGGRETQANIISVSYPSTDDEAPNIDNFNKDPLHYSSQGAKEFAHKVLIPLLQSGQDINILSKSYGATFSKMSMNELRRLGYPPSPDRIRFVSTGNVARLNYPLPDDATEIYFEGSGDMRAANLNIYKEPPPVGHKQLTIVPMSSHILKVLTDTPDRVSHWDVSPHNITLRETHDPERHTTRMYTALGANSPGAPLLWRVVRNMLTLKGAAFTTETALEPCPPLVPTRHDIGHGEESYDISISRHIKGALERGRQSNEIKAVLFDWDLTLADAEESNLSALNATFNAMENAGYSLPKQGYLDRQKMREVFIGTVSTFFQCAYSDQGQLAVDKAIEEFRRFRSEKRAEVKLLPGAKELLRQLQKDRIAVGIVSNKDTDELRALKNLLLPEGEFAHIITIGHESGRAGKPSPEPIQTAIKALGLPLERASSVLYVGDQVKSDVAAALAVGCKACLIGESDRDTLFANARHLIEGERDGNHAILLNDGGHRILFVRDLNTLAEYLGTLLHQSQQATTAPAR